MPFIHPAVFVIGIILVIIFAIVLASQFFEVAQYKGYTSKKYFWIPFLFGIMGYLLVIALPDRGRVRKQEPQKQVIKNLGLK